MIPTDHKSSDHQLIWQISNYLHGFIHPNGTLNTNDLTWFSTTAKKIHRYHDHQVTGLFGISVVVHVHIGLSKNVNVYGDANLDYMHLCTC